MADLFLSDKEGFEAMLERVLGGGSPFNAPDCRSAFGFAGEMPPPQAQNVTFDFTKA